RSTVMSHLESFLDTSYCITFGGFMKATTKDHLLPTARKHKTKSTNLVLIKCAIVLSVAGLALGFFLVSRNGAFSASVRRNQPSITRMFLSVDGNANARDQEGSSALIIAAISTIASDRGIAAGLLISAAILALLTPNI